jgi:hypothetical protein
LRLLLVRDQTTCLACTTLLLPLTQVDNASLVGALKSACIEMGLQPVEPFLEKVSLAYALSHLFAPC